MAQPHKGDRELTQSRLPREVYNEVKRRAAEEGVSISQFIANVMSAHVGRADLVRRAGQMPLSA